jgi:hypothetical protein
VKHFAERDAAKRGVDDIVQRRLVGLAEIFPGAERRERRGLVETQTVGAPRVEVVVALASARRASKTITTAARVLE